MRELYTPVPRPLQCSLAIIPKHGRCLHTARRRAHLFIVGYTAVAIDWHANTNINVVFVNSQAVRHGPEVEL